MTAYLVAISSHPSESLHIDFIITREIIVKIYQTSLKICNMSRGMIDHDFFFTLFGDL